MTNITPFPDLVRDTLVSLKRKRGSISRLARMMGLSCAIFYQWRDRVYNPTLKMKNLFIKHSLTIISEMDNEDNEIDEINKASAELQSILSDDQSINPKS